MARIQSKSLLQLRAEAEIERRRRRQKSKKSPARTFTTQYHDDPVAWVRDCIQFPPGEGLTPYQVEILAALADRRRACVRGPHGLGKTAINALAILWFAITSEIAGEDWKVPTTASAWRQLTKFLWPEIVKWVRRLRWDCIPLTPWRARDEMLMLSIKLEHGEAFALASDRSELIEGAHASRLLYVFDEAKTIPPPTWDSAEGAFSTGNVYWLATSTPGEPVGRFYEIQARRAGYEDWWVRAVSLEECVAAGRINPGWADQRRRQWGMESAVYKNRVRGDFAASAEDNVIPLSWVEAAIERWHELHDDAGRWNIDLGSMTAVGADVGRGGDKSTEALRYSRVVSEIRAHGAADTMVCVGRIGGILKAHGGRAVVDVVGIGAGVVDRLREQRFKVIAYNAGAKTDLVDRSGELGFADCRAAGWWGLRERLEPVGGDHLALPPTDEDLLIGDLTAPHWKTQSSGKIRVEAKEEVQSRLGRSTDYGDAVVMAFWDSGGEAGWEDVEGLGTLEDHESPFR